MRFFHEKSSFASFKIEKIDALLLIGLAHAIPFHADGLCILNINTLLFTPGPECRHLLARHVIEVAEVTPHVYAEEIVDAFGECLLGMTVKEVVCFWAFRLGVRYANCNISLSGCSGWLLTGRFARNRRRTAFSLLQDGNSTGSPKEWVSHCFKYGSTCT